MSLRHPGSRHFAKLDRKRWALLRLRIFERDGWRCVRCNKAGRLECDHIKPMDAGGDPYEPSNLQSLCRECHLAKTGAERSPPDPEREAWQELVAEIANYLTLCATCVLCRFWYQTGVCNHDERAETDHPALRNSPATQRHREHGRVTRSDG